MSQIISHRGGTFLWPENSLLAFRQTLTLPVEQAECDIHLSADGEPVVIHDGLLDRTTDARGPVSEMTLASLQRLRLRGAGGETIPSLAQVARLFRGSGMTFRVEIKAGPQGKPYPDVLRRVLKVLDEEGVTGQTVIIAFHGPTAAAATREARLKGAVWLVEAGLRETLGLPALVAAGKSLGVTAIETHESAADADYVTAMREAGLGCGVWGANHEPSIRRMLALGIDAFATDDPPLALRLRG
ncbi:glycerophosphodiester phosphodiesterase [Acetobacteraceae bacterium H6797]|nr:glycerophosphodiester phosphodiesterase [Acetobacteraceae bacterium H6797]